MSVVTSTLKLRLKVDDRDKVKFRSFNRGLQRTEHALNGVGNAAARVAGVGIRLFTVGVLAMTGALTLAGREFIRINEKFAQFEITVGSALKSVSAAKDITGEIARITAKSPIPFQQLAETVQSFAIIPQTRSRLLQQALEGQIREEGFLQEALMTVQSMAAFRPDQGSAGAVFALREAMGGQMRSLFRRFDIPSRLLTDVAGKTMTELKNDANAMLDAIGDVFKGIISPQAIEQMARQPSLLLQNTMEQLFELPFLYVGRSGAYDALLTEMTEVFDDITEFVTEKFVGELAPGLSAAFIEGLGLLKESLNNLMTSFADELDIDLGNGTFIENAFTAADKFFKGTFKTIPKIINFLASNAEGIVKVFDAIVRIFKGVGFALKAINDVFGTTVATLVALLSPLLMLRAGSIFKNAASFMIGPKPLKTRDSFSFADQRKGWLEKAKYTSGAPIQSPAQTFASQGTFTKVGKKGRTSFRAGAAPVMLPSGKMLAAGEKKTFSRPQTKLLRQQLGIARTAAARAPMSPMQTAYSRSVAAGMPRFPMMQTPTLTGKELATNAGALAVKSNIATVAMGALKLAGIMAAVGVAFQLLEDITRHWIEGAKRKADIEKDVDEEQMSGFRTLNKYEPLLGKERFAKLNEQAMKLVSDQNAQLEFLDDKLNLKSTVGSAIKGNIHKFSTSKVKGELGETLRVMGLSLGEAENRRITEFMQSLDGVEISGASRINRAGYIGKLDLEDKLDALVKQLGLRVSDSLSSIVSSGVDAEIRDLAQTAHIAEIKDGLGLNSRYTIDDIQNINAAQLLKTVGVSPELLLEDMAKLHDKATPAGKADLPDLDVLRELLNDGLSEFANTAVTGYISEVAGRLKEVSAVQFLGAVEKATGVEFLRSLYAGITTIRSTAFSGNIRKEVEALQNKINPVAQTQLELRDFRTVYGGIVDQLSEVDFGKAFADYERILAHTAEAFSGSELGERIDKLSEELRSELANQRISGEGKTNYDIFKTAFTGMMDEIRTEAYEAVMGMLVGMSSKMEFGGLPATTGELSLVNDSFDFLNEVIDDSLTLSSKALQREFEESANKFADKAVRNVYGGAFEAQPSGAYVANQKSRDAIRDSAKTSYMASRGKDLADGLDNLDKFGATQKSAMAAFQGPIQTAFTAMQGAMMDAADVKGLTDEGRFKAEMNFLTKQVEYNDSVAASFAERRQTIKLIADPALKGTAEAALSSEENIIENLNQAAAFKQKMLETDQMILKENESLSALTKSGVINAHQKTASEKSYLSLLNKGDETVAQQAVRHEKISATLEGQRNVNREILRGIEARLASEGDASDRLKEQLHYSKEQLIVTNALIDSAIELRDLNREIAYAKDPTNIQATIALGKEVDIDDQVRRRTNPSDYSLPEEIIKREQATQARLKAINLGLTPNDDPVRQGVETLIAESESEEAYQKMVNTGEGMMRGLREGLKAGITPLLEMGQQMSSSFASGFGNAFTDFATGAKNAKDAFKDFAYDFLRQLTMMLAQQAAFRAISIMLGMVNPAATAASTAATTTVPQGVMVSGGNPFDGIAGGGFAEGGVISLRDQPAGGLLQGGSGYKDDLPILAMGNEYIIRKERVKQFGVGFFDSINNEGRVPNYSTPEAYATGGVVGGGSGSYSSSGTSPVFNVSTSVTLNNNGTATTETSTQDSDGNEEMLGQLGDSIKSVVAEYLSEESRPGRLVDRLITSKMRR